MEEIEEFLVIMLIIGAVCFGFTNRDECGPRAYYCQGGE